MGKAGGYGIQGPAALFVESIEGDYNNIFGLPAAHVMQEAKKLLKATKYKTGTISPFRRILAYRKGLMIYVPVSPKTV